MRISDLLLEDPVGIIKDRPTFKTADFPGPFTALGQNILNDTPMGARRFFETEASFCYCVLGGMSFCGHFHMP